MIYSVKEQKADQSYVNLYLLMGERPNCHPWDEVYSKYRLKDKILEVGVGLGALLRPLARKGIKCVGLEKNKLMFNEVQRIDRTSNLNFICDDFFMMDVKSQYDLVILSSNFINIQGEDNLLTILEKASYLTNNKRYLGLEFFDFKWLEQCSSLTTFGKGYSYLDLKPIEYGITLENKLISENKHRIVVKYEAKDDQYIQEEIIISLKDANITRSAKKVGLEFKEEIKQNKVNKCLIFQKLS